MGQIEEGPDRPTKYDIAALLNSGNQPFEDLDEGTLIALGDGLDLDTVPVVLSEDGRVLIDGHQRLKALSMKGRKTVGADQVTLKKGVTAKNALEWAVRLNVQRRQLTVEQKAQVARRLQRERHWSQTKIAKLFGVSQPAVSQWLRDFPGEEDEESDEFKNYVVGEDNKVYEAKPPRKPKRIPEAWDPDGGYLRKDLVKLTYKVKTIPVEVEKFPPEELDAIKAILGDAIVVLQSRLDEITGDDPTSY